MKRIPGILKRFFVDTAGQAAAASFVICVLSGVLIAIPYDINAPFISIAWWILDNPAAVYFRNIHFWSAQFFFFLTLVHIFDHFIRRTEYNLTKGIWFRLVAAIPVIFFAMISGFILKGDADSISARMILTSLIERFPVAGNFFRSFLIGSREDLSLVYVHHIATATIFTGFVIYEHSRIFWPKYSVFLTITFSLLLISFFFQVSLGTETGKGPWYFIGLQELLSWLSNPGRAWAFIAAVLGMILCLRYARPGWNKGIKAVLLALFIIYTGLTITGEFFRGEAWQWKNPITGGSKRSADVFYHSLTRITSEEQGIDRNIPVILDKPEGCMACHFKTAGFSPAHDPAAIGCYSCHGGDAFTLDKKRAHKGMRSVPGNLDDATVSCGQPSCHPDIAGRVPRSIMSTMSGVVTVDRVVFNEGNDPDALSHIREIGHSPADQHLRDLCANCHLGNPKTEPGPVSQLTRGGGCNACHLNYDSSSLASLEIYQSHKSIELSDTFYHPKLSLAITDEHCFGCHSRSGRISTSYQGLHETLQVLEEIEPAGEYTFLEDKRVFRYVGEDVHHRLGMLCIDCHISAEIMGDGDLYSHKEQQVRVSCKDCHFAGEPATIPGSDLDAESSKIVALRKWSVGGKEFITTRKRRLPLINVWVDSTGAGYIRLRGPDTVMRLKATPEVCYRGKAHQSLACETCHSPWVPQCIGCHNTYEPSSPGYDMLTGTDKTGTWVEFVGKFLSGPPTLGVVEDSSGSRMIKTFIPGMILSIDTSSYYSKNTGLPIFRRLYAPVFAHTIVKESRSCKSCHLDPSGLGYGRGDLTYEASGKTGKFVFISQFAENKQDGLPEDAWIGLWEDRKGMVSTRKNARPFNRREQQDILTVGACLTCHDEDSAIMQESLSDFEALKKRAGLKCRLPDWL